MEIKEIFDLYKDYLDKEIVVKGWIRKHRKQKEIGFIDISDGTCFKKLLDCFKEIWYIIYRQSNNSLYFTYNNIAID